MIAETFAISRRFRGPPASGNGGYVCGRLARHLGAPCAARLRLPPPLDTELRIEVSAERARLLHGSMVVAEAWRARPDIRVPPAPTFAEAVAASERYVGFVQHSFPGCFVCGPQRAEGDGMRIFPGAIGEPPVVAAPWIPDRSLAGASGAVASEFLWAALDCPGGIAVLPVAAGNAVVLGEMCAEIDGAVTPGDHCVVIGWRAGTDGRKRYAGSAAFDARGKRVAWSRATWIEVPESAFSKV